MMKKEEQNGSLVLLGLGLVAALALVMIFVGTKYVYKPSYPTLAYNNFEFAQKDKFWHAQWQRKDQVYTISLRFNPKEVEDVPVTGVLNNTFNKRRTIYITFDPEGDDDAFKYLAVAGSELTVNLAGPLGKQIAAACTKNVTSACANRPIARCEDADKNVIFLNGQGNPSIMLNHTCMTFSGAGFDMVKAVDKALYLWMGIIPRPPAQQGPTVEES